MAAEKKHKTPDQAKAARPKTASKKKREELSDEQLDKVSGGNANIASIDFRKTDKPAR